MAPPLHLLRRMSNGLGQRNKAWIRLFFILTLSLVVVASAEEGSHGGFGTAGGRAFVDPNGNVSNLQQILSSCAVGRNVAGAGVGNIGSAFSSIGGAGLPGAQSFTNFGGGEGVLQTSAPEGAPGVAGATGSVASNASGAALFQSKCLSCHSPGGSAAGKPITAAKGATRIAEKTMPPLGSPQADGLSDADRAAIAAFLPSLGR